MVPGQVLAVVLVAGAQDDVDVLQFAHVYVQYQYEHSQHVILLCHAHLVLIYAYSRTARTSQQPGGSSFAPEDTKRSQPVVTLRGGWSCVVDLPSLPAFRAYLLTSRVHRVPNSLFHAVCL
jgi:hypothetical protein|eukprot:COSAG01_NODE_3671_length_5810_cov_9.618456_8_plen_121_part_00